MLYPFDKLTLFLICLQKTGNYFLESSSSERSGVSFEKSAVIYRNSSFHRH